MKKLFLAAAAALLCVTLSAQVFVGGSFTMSSNGNVDRLTNTTTNTSNFVISPNAGLIMSEDLLVGARLDLQFGSTPTTNTSNFGFGLNPYARYRLLAVGPFSLLAEGGINFSTFSTKIVNTGVGYQKDTDTSFGLYVEPVITYPFDEHITLEAGLNIARLSFTSTASKGNYHVDNPAGDTATDDQTNSRFALGASANDIIGGGIGAIRIGFTYKF